VAGLKYGNITAFKEKAGLASLYLKKENDKISFLKAVGNQESLDNFDIIYETHFSLYETFVERLKSKLK